MVEEDATVEAPPEVDFELEAALLDDAHGMLDLGTLVGILGSSAGAGSGAQAHLRGIDAEDDGCDGEGITEAPAREARIDGCGRRILCKREPASPAIRIAVALDGQRVVGKVRIVDAVAGHILADRPFPALAGDLGEARCELLGPRDGDGDIVAGSVGSGTRDAWARGQETRADDLDDGIGTPERDGTGFRCLGAERCRKAGMREEDRTRCLRTRSERLLDLIAEGDLLREGVLEDP